MKRYPLLLLGLAVVTVLLMYMLSFQVQFNEMALVTTFGRASENSVRNAEGDSAGLYFKLPWPIQQVRRFDRRLRVLDDRLEQQETKDKQVIVMNNYIVWRISEPLAFYRSLNNVANTESLLRDRLRTACSVIGEFTFDDLSNEDPSKLRLSLAEEAILKKVQRDLEDKSWGIEVQTVGIKRIILPEQITESVFQRMRQTRQRLAQKARSEGDAIARGILAKARSDSERILAFADRRAQSIRSQGDAAAADYYRVFARNEDFAIFMRKLESLKATLSHNTTFLLDTKMMPFDLLKRPISDPEHEPETFELDNVVSDIPDQGE